MQLGLRYIEILRVAYRRLKAAWGSAFEKLNGDPSTVGEETLGAATHDVGVRDHRRRLLAG